MHQFSKVELFSLTRAESGQESEETLQEMVLLQREIVEDLGLHYRWEDAAQGWVLGFDHERMVFFFFSKQVFSSEG